MSLRPVHVSGAIYVSIAVFGAVASALGSDDAAKWIDPRDLWYARNISTAIAAGLLALKMFRSTAYSDDVMEVKKNGNGHAKDTPPPSPNVQP